MNRVVTVLLALNLLVLAAILARPFVLLPFAVTPQATFWQLTQAFDPRQFQFGLKVSF